MNVSETRDMAAVILDVKEQLGVTQILVEHDMAMVMGIVDRVLVLDFGRVIALGRPEETQANPDVTGLSRRRIERGQSERWRR